MIKALLRGMTYGSKEARQYFPRLLQIKTLASDQTKKVFNDEVNYKFRTILPQASQYLWSALKLMISRFLFHQSSLVPAWMFLGWISQIISELKFDRECFIDELIVRLAQTYPTAIAYPFKLSHSQYTDTCLEVVNDRPLIGRINDIIRNPLIDSFVKGLAAVCVPFKMLHYHLMTLLTEFRMMSENQFYKRVTNILETVFPTDRSYYGTEYDKLNAFQDAVRKLITLSGTLNLSFLSKIFNFLNSTLFLLTVVDDRLTIANELKNLVSKLRSGQHDNTELARYSPYLSKFQWCGEEAHLELPGQYSGDRCPILSEHIKIIKFDEKITIFKSMRMPIRIKIYCSNGKTYQYLVKYGEDMRQDERIQQIFHHMGGLLNADEKCRNHQLNIKGYRVVPISTYCGILSFVEHTMPMHDFIRQSLERKEGSAAKMDECRDKFIRFVKVHSIGEKDQNNMHLYGRSIMNYDRNQVIVSDFDSNVEL